MVLQIVILFLSALIPGIAAFYITTFSNINFKLTLVFAGGYLFTITILHIMPELFLDTPNPQYISLLILTGFFIQVILENLSKGIEHGHLHTEEFKQNQSSPILLVVGLCIHSLLEGTLLTHPSELHSTSNAPGILLGIVLHKMPAAFVFTSILLSFMNKKPVLFLLLLFSIASPIGLLITHFLNETKTLDEQVFHYVFALVSGNFLHISTTIFFESSPHHHFSSKRLLIMLLGVGVAILVELL